MCTQNYFGIVICCRDLDKFDFYKFSEHYDDYKYAMELTSEILFLEIIYRIIVCLFEVSHKTIVSVVPNKNFWLARETKFHIYLTVLAVKLINITLTFATDAILFLT